MTKVAAQLRVEKVAAPAGARVIDMRTRKPWRPPQPRSWPFLFDMAITFSLVTLGAWLFLKMQNG